MKRLKIISFITIIAFLLTNGTPFIGIFPVKSVQAKTVTIAKYEAENAKRSTTSLVSKKYSGYTGKGFVIIPGKKVGAYLTFKAYVKSTKTRQLKIRFSNASAGSSSISIIVNGKSSSISFLPTKGGSIWKVNTFSKTLKMGTNTITLKRTKSDADSVNIDNLVVEENVTPKPTPTVKPTSKGQQTASPSPTGEPAASTTPGPTPGMADLPWNVFPNETPWPIDNSIQQTNAYYVATDGKDTNPGTFELPWLTLGTAVKKLKAGNALYIRGGTYNISLPITFGYSGSAGKRIVVSSYPNELAVIDAHAFDKGSTGFSHDVGAIYINNVSYITIKNLKVQNAHCKGIATDRASYIDILNNQINNTFACGIGIWDYTKSGANYKFINIIGNTVTHANTWDMIPKTYTTTGEPPHEAISIAGVVDFEVAFNQVYNCDKEGIDVKEVSKRGKVHHNYVHNIPRQGLYADSWFGTLSDIEYYNNIVTRCGGAGAVVSVEGGSSLNNVTFHNNLIYNNLGTGFYFSKWGNDGLRQDLKIYNNTFVHNGYGIPDTGGYFWITGGMYFYSSNLKNVQIFNNIFSDDKAYEIAYSDAYVTPGKTIDSVLSEKGINISYNLIDDHNNLKYPIDVGWTGNFSKAYQYFGTSYQTGNPQFKDIATADLRLGPNSPALNNGNPDALYNHSDGTRSDIGALN